MAQPGYSAISNYSRVEILHLLQTRPARTIAELSAATGLHANTVREHLQRLIEAGCVVPETEHRTTRGRPRVLYSAATGTDAASSPIAQRKARDAARRGDLMRRVMPWTDAELPADALHQLDALVDDLEEAGFAPVVDEEALTVDLTPCAHAQAQAGHRGVLCSVHLGLMQSVLTEAGGPLAVDGMHPSCDPAQCVVQLARA
jgi:predicted ArsR family transcriptional regulator